MIPLLLALAATEPAAAAADAPEKLLLLDFKDDGVGASAVRIIHDSLASHLSKDARLDVLSAEDMRRALDVESQKRAMGCGDDDSCLAEIAGALGARLLVHGTAGKLGDLVVVNVSLYDAEAQKSVGRETIEVEKLDELPPRLRNAGDLLVARLFGGAPAPASGGNELLLWSGVGLGAAGFLLGGAALVVAVVSDGKARDETAFVDKDGAAKARDLFYGIAAGGGVLLVVGGALVGAAFATE